MRETLDRWLRAKSLLALLLASTHLLGCTTDVGDIENVDETSQAILGGTKTMKRPEVGTTDHGGCTATLVSNKAFVFAAHCMDFEAAREGTGAFYMERTGFDPMQLNVAGVYSYGDELGGADVAVGILEDPAPADWTSGAQLNWAANDGVVNNFTFMGYGCTNRSTLAGTGTKRYREYSGWVSKFGCPGDSGGPRFAGALSDYGDLLMVHSSYHTSTGNDTSGFVDTPWVEGMIRRFSDGLEPGLDRYGFDYQWSAASSAGACRVRCFKDARCKAFTYAADGNCHLKHTMGRAIVDTTTTTGVPEGHGLFNPGGTDLRVFAETSADRCASACALDSACMAYFQSSGTCRLKSSVGTPAACVPCSAGLRRGFETDINRPGGEWKNLITQTAVACSHECVKDGICKAFTWVPGSKRCYMKYAVAPPEAAPGTGYISGVLRGAEFAYDRPGSDYKNFKAETWQYCATACFNDSNCKSWTLSGLIGFNARCYLRNDVPARVATPGKISGIKGMEFF
jgi:hypothetical protein